MIATYKQEPLTPTRRFAEEFGCSMQAVREALRRAGFRQRKPARRSSGWELYRARRSQAGESGGGGGRHIEIQTVNVNNETTESDNRNNDDLDYASGSNSDSEGSEPLDRQQDAKL